MIHVKEPYAHPHGSTTNHTDGSSYPRGSKYPLFMVSGSQKQLGAWFWELETSNIGYLDPLIMIPKQGLRPQPGSRRRRA